MGEDDDVGVGPVQAEASRRLLSPPCRAAAAPPPPPPSPAKHSAHHRPDQAIAGEKSATLNSSAIALSSGDAIRIPPTRLPFPCPRSFSWQYYYIIIIYCYYFLQYLIKNKIKKRKRKRLDSFPLSSTQDVKLVDSPWLSSPSLRSSRWGASPLDVRRHLSTVTRYTSKLRRSLI